jgi:multidrug efflux pump subunit AcrA (membrane-fusion protein)
MMIQAFSKKAFFSALLLAAGLALAACSAKTAAPTPQPAGQPASLPAALTAEGVLTPASSVDVSFSLPGQAAEVLVREGDLVSAGQVLARLAPSADASAALARAQQQALLADQALSALKDNATLALAQANLAVPAAQAALDDAKKAFENDTSDINLANRKIAEVKLALAKAAQQKMIDGAGVDPDQLAALTAQAQTAHAALASAQAAVDALELKAPSAGTVTNLNLTVGQRVPAGFTAATLADLSNWVVKTNNLTELNVAEITPGQLAAITLDALPDVKLTGKVTAVARRYEVIRGDVTFTVTIAITDPTPDLRWGMTSAVTFAR